MENRILKFWDDRALKKNLVCTNDDLLENFELKFLIRLIKKNSFVLDIGSGDGTLLHKLNTLKKTNGTGIDFSQNLINLARKKDKKANYICLDMQKINTLKNKLRKYDFIVTKRSIQNLSSWDDQKKFINHIYLFCKKNTKIYFIESSKDTLENINNSRKKFGLKKILMPWHNLYLDDKKILNTKFKKIKLVKIHELCSTYYYYSRVINAALSKKESRKPKYKDHLNLLGWRASQDLIKGFSQLKMYEFKKV